MRPGGQDPDWSSGLQIILRKFRGLEDYPQASEGRLFESVPTIR
jgi:hypothetical protein